MFTMPKSGNQPNQTVGKSKVALEGRQWGAGVTWVRVWVGQGEGNKCRHGRGGTRTNGNPINKANKGLGIWGVVRLQKGIAGR